MSLYKRIKDILRTTLDYLFYHKAAKKHLFIDFHRRYFNLSPKKYHNYQQLVKDCPQYDIYITGSDQVWNVYTVKNDPAYYLSFIPNSAFRISFGSSFAVKKIPKEYEASIRRRLSLYSFIGVRERSGLNILRDLSLPPNIKCANTCDPTFLLPVEEYDKIAHTSRFHYNKPYILVYILNYAFNPHPGIDSVTKTLEKEFECDVIVIGKKKISNIKNIKYVYKIGPGEFLWLFKHAKFIITSSFHGTAFSLIFQRPFVAIVPTEKELDTRIQDLIQNLGIQDCIIQSDNTQYEYNPLNNIYTNEIREKINEYVTESKYYLKDAINTYITSRM